MLFHDPSILEHHENQTFPLMLDQLLQDYPYITHIVLLHNPYLGRKTYPNIFLFDLHFLPRSIPPLVIDLIYEINERYNQQSAALYNEYTSVSPEQNILF